MPTGSLQDFIGYMSDYNSVGKASSLFPFLNGTHGGISKPEWNSEVDPNSDGYEDYLRDYKRKEQHANTVLEQAKAFDPNAHYDERGQLQFDQTKLPKWKGGDAKSFDKYGGLISLHEDGAKDRVKDPRYIIRDENYGDYTLRGNVNQAESDKAGGGIFGMTEKYMPAIISAIMAAGMGAAVGPAMGGVLSGTLGPNGIANKLAMGDKMDWGNSALKMGSSFIPGGSQALGAYNAWKAMQQFQRNRGH
jgi:hypothetical protein